MGSADKIKILLGGDVFLGGDDFLRRGPDTTPWPSMRPLIDGADIFFVNLEGPVIGAPSARKDNKVRIANPPWSFDCLRNAGVSLVSLANNHSADFGTEGVASTLSYAGDFPAVGLGIDAEQAAKPAFVKVRGATLGFLAFAEDIGGKHLYAKSDQPGYNRLERKHVLETSKAALDLCDALIIYLHHGLMRLHQPSPWVRDLCLELAELGVSMIVGSHCHHYQPYEWAGKTLICYGLGDLFFGEVSGPGLYGKHFMINKTSLIVDANIGSDGRVMDFKMVPFRQVSNLETRKIEGYKKKMVLRKVQAMSGSLVKQAYPEMFLKYNSRDPKIFLGKTKRFIREMPPMLERIYWACKSKYPANMVVSPGYRKSKNVERALSVIEKIRSKKPA